MMEKDLYYWYEHTSMKGFAKLIKEKLPIPFRWFTNVYVDEKWLDRKSNVIRVYYSCESYANVKIKDRFCYEFTLETLEQAANGKNVIVA